MSGSHDIQKEVKRYLWVFGALLVMTVVTVLVSYLHIGLAGAIALALAIALFKSSLVASFFMHLIAERPIIYVLLISVMFLFLSLILLLYVGVFDVPEGTRFVS
jgi:caa(3)-type oxidase subunit IV